MKTIQWEYLQEANLQNESLRGLGLLGWELVSVLWIPFDTESGESLHVFKRPIQDVDPSGICFFCMKPDCNQKHDEEN